MADGKTILTNGGVKDYEVYINNQTGELIGDYKRDITEKDVRLFFVSMNYLGRIGKLMGHMTPEAEKLATDCYKATTLEKKTLEKK